MRAELNLPPSQPLVPVAQGPIELSPDATRVAMLVGNIAKPSIAIRDFASDDTRVLAGTEGAT